MTNKKAGPGEGYMVVAQFGGRGRPQALVGWDTVWRKHEDAVACARRAGAAGLCGIEIVVAPLDDSSE